MKRRILVFFVTVMMLINSFPNLVLAKKTDTDVATVVLGENLYLKNFSSVSVGDSTGSVVKRGGRESWLCDKAATQAKRYIKFDLSDSFLKKIEDGTTVEIDVEYYDVDSTHFTLVYDGIDNEKTQGEIVYTKTTGKWKTHTFVLDDPYFDNRLENGFDFYIGAYSSSMGTSPASVAIGSVTVRKYPQRNSIKTDIVSDEIGNVFGNGDEKKFNITFSNLLDNKQEASVTYRVITETEAEVWSKTEKIAIEKGETISKEVTPEFEKYGLYFFEVVLDKGNGKVQNHRTPFSFMNSDEDGVKNTRFLICANIWGSSSYGRSGEVELFNKLNAGGTRAAMDWNWMGAFNKFTSGQEKDWKFYEQYPDSVIGLWYGNVNFDGMNEYAIPETEGQFNGWKDYVTKVVERAKSVGLKKFEIWNEPKVFSGNRAKQTDVWGKYHKLLEVTYPLIKEIYPEAQIGVGSITGVSNPANKDDFMKSISYGMADFADAIALHPYTQTISPEKAGTVDHIDFYHDAFLEKGNDVEVWHTEYGFTDADMLMYDDAELAKRKAYYITNSYIQYLSNGVGDVYCCYEFYDDGIVKTNREHNFGLMNSGVNSTSGVNLSSTLSSLAVANLNYMMADAEPENIINISDNVNIYKYKSNKFSKNIAVTWAKNGYDTVTLELDDDEVEIVDMLGNRKSISNKDGVYTFTLDETPIYIMGDFKTIKNSDKLSPVECEKLSYEISANDILNLKLTKNIDDEIVLIPQLPLNIEIIDENIEFFENTATVKLRMPPKSGIVEKIEFEVQNNGKTIQIIDVFVSIGGNATVTADFILADENNLKKWQGEFKVVNLSQTQCINGTIKISSPRAWAGITLKTGYIPAGKESIVRSNLPELNYLGMYTLDATLTLSNGSVCQYEEAVDFTIAQYTQNPPKIDGVLDDGEWNTCANMIANDASLIRLMTNYGGESDLSTIINTAWDYNNLYLMFDVTDNVHHNPKTGVEIWGGDSVQFGIFFGSKASVDIGQAGTDYNELGAALTQSGVETYRWRAQNNAHQVGVIENSEVAINRVGTHTIYEICIPWSEILSAGDVFDPTNPLGFSALVNDNDGSGRRGWIEYASGIGESKNTGLFTYIKLLGGEK